jgi:predicted TIM-barrel fold metal-dependent hydrolase
MKIIDSHQHVFWHGRDDAGLIRDMDEQGVSLAWLLTWDLLQPPRQPESTSFIKALNPARVRTDGSHPGIQLADLLAAHRNYPGRFVLGYCPNPAMPDAAELFEAACDMHGVRVCGEWKFRMLIDDPRSLELFRAAGRRKTPVVLHLDAPYLPPKGGQYEAAWYGGTIHNLERVLEACPETTFLGHAPGFWRELSADADVSAEVYPRGPVVRGGRVEQMIERHANLFADLSAGSALIAMKRDTGYTKELLTRFADRFLFARDYYGGELLVFLRSLDLPAAVLQKILHDNALALVNPDSALPGREILKLS